MTYRIRNWTQHFENNRTRELKELRFVILPNKHDGDGYTELLDHKNGASHYGAWVSIVQVASKCDPRGTLLRDGAKPHDSTSLSRLTRLPKAVFDEAIPRLVSIGWLEAVDEDGNTETQSCHIDSTIPQEPAALGRHNPAPPCGKVPLNRIEENGIEKKPSLVEQARRVFAFWQEHMTHPKAVFDEARERKITSRLKDGYSADDLIAAIKGCKLTPYNMGQNERNEVYDTIDLICRDAAHVDRFMAAANAQNGHKPPTQTIRDQIQQREAAQ